MDNLNIFMLNRNRIKLNFLFKEVKISYVEKKSLFINIIHLWKN